MSSKDWGSLERCRPEWKQLVSDQGADYWRSNAAMGIKTMKTYGWILIPLYLMNFFTQAESMEALVISILLWVLGGALNVWAFMRLKELRPFFPWTQGVYLAFAITSSVLGCAGLIVWLILRSASKTAAKHIEWTIQALEGDYSPYPREAPLGFS